MQLIKVDRGSITSHHTEGAVRWHARELVTSDSDEPAISPATDVWSFGMLCLEIMTGERPYAHRRRDAEVIEDLISKRLPHRPIEQVVQKRGLTDDLWNMMLSCWNLDPKKETRYEINRNRNANVQGGYIPGRYGHDRYGHDRYGPGRYGFQRSTIGNCIHGFVIPGIQLSESPGLMAASSPRSPMDFPSLGQERSTTWVGQSGGSSQTTDPVQSNSAGRLIGSSSNTKRGTSSSTARIKARSHDEDILSFCDRIDFGDPADLESQLALNAPGIDTRRQLSALAYISVFDHQSDGEISGGSISSSLPSSINSPMRRTRTPSPSSSVPVGPSPLLDFRGLDTKVVVQRNHEGRLLRATLAGLVEELLSRSQGMT